MEVSFSSEIKGFGRFPTGINVGSGTMTHHPHGAEDASYQGTLMTAEEGEQFIWWVHGKSKVIQGGRIKGMILVYDLQILKSCHG